jgi:hypothetical protein
VAIIYTQVKVLEHFQPNRYFVSLKEDEMVDIESHFTIVWLLFEVIVFYSTIFSIALFISITRCKNFRTIRERANFGGKLRQ